MTAGPEQRRAPDADRARILLIASPGLPAALKGGFAGAGFVLDETLDQQRAAQWLAAGRHQLAILALNGPDQAVIAAIDDLRRRDVATPVLVLSAQPWLENATLEAGADAFVVLPVAPDELVARARALLRRCTQAAGGDREMAIGDLRLDLVAGAARKHDRPLALTRRQFDLLATLARRPGQVLGRDVLLHQLYNGIDAPGAATIDVFVHAIRRQLHAAQSRARIVTRRGLGFCLETGDTQIVNA